MDGGGLDVWMEGVLTEERLKKVIGGGQEEDLGGVTEEK